MINKILSVVLAVLLLMPALARAANMQVTSSASPVSGGSISPSGIKYFSGPGAANYAITVKPGWSISSVKIDNVDVGAPYGTSYQIPYASGTVHTIKATFVQTTYSITTSAGAGGVIQVTGGALTGIAPGSSRTLIVAPSTGYKISTVTVDGVTQALPADPMQAMSIPFTNIQDNHSISATFIIIPVVAVTAGSDQTVTVNGSAPWSTTLNGSATSNAGPITYQWNQVSAPPSATAGFSSPTNSTTSFSFNALGCYKVTLTAASGGLSITSSQITITVISPAQAASSTCTTCHIGSAQVTEWQTSVHATSSTGASCPACHMPNNEAHPGQVTEAITYTCVNCHTANPANHPIEIGSTTCVTCHNPHSAAATGGGCNGCHDSPPADATHLKHYGSSTVGVKYGDLRITNAFTNYSSGYIFGCGNCHPLDVSKHNNGTVDVELYNQLATPDSLKTRNPATAAYTLGPEVFTDSKGLHYTKGTCSNVYCHSYTEKTTTGSIPDSDPTWESKVVTTRIYKTVTWGGTPLGCTGCHGNPTKTTYATNDGGAGDSHAWIDSDGYENLHNFNHGMEPVSCCYCHNDTVKQLNTYVRDNNDVSTLSEVPIKNFSNHVNGSNDVSFDKQNSMVYTVWGSPPVPLNLADATYDPVVKNCSNVSCHINQTTVKWGTPYRWWYNECDACHQYSN